MRTLTALCLLAALVTAGCGQAPVAATTPPTGMFESERLVTPPTGFHGPPGSRWLSVVINPGVPTVTASWVAHLQAISDRIATRAAGRPPVLGVSVIQRMPNGSRVLAVAGRIDPVAAAKVQPTMSRADADAVARRGAKRLGLTVLRISHPSVAGFGAAPMLVARTSHPDRFVARHPFAFLELGLDRQQPGVLEVLGPSGRLIEIVGAIPGAGIEMSGHARKYGCIGSCPLH